MLGSPSSVRRSRQRRAATTIAIAIAAVSCTRATAPAPPDPPDATFLQRMHDRWDAAVRVEHAIVHGDLPRARAEARLMAGLEYPTAGSPWLVSVDDTARAAGRIASASTLVDAAYGLGAMGRSCGACHERTPAPTNLPPVPAAPTMAGTMIGHAWAAERMWEGLIGPSLQRWVDGALRLRADPPSGPPDEAAAIAAELAGAALRPISDDERAHVFGALLATCAACHQVRRDKQPTP